MDNVFEKKISSFLATGLYLITIIVIAGPVSDPVNVPKLAALGLFSFGAIPYLIYNLTRKQAIVNHKIMISIILLFNIILILVTVLSGAPTSQNIYGMYGRNTGLITYVSFSCILASIALFQEKKSIEKILIGFFAAGCTNLIYGLIEHFIGDPFPWKNNYGALLGTFGNPDFAGAFYGLLAGMLFAFILSEGISNSSRNIATLLFSICLLCVYWTDTTQGILVAIISTAIVLLIFLHFKFKKKYVTVTYFAMLIIGGFLILMGILQKGPLSTLLYKRSVSLRGVYWDAAIQTGKENFWLGVGLDSFGNWYRRMRSLKGATWLPGPETITNVAHNYYLDIFASGGLLLLVSYSMITVLGIVSSFRIIKNLKQFNPYAATLISMFVAFQAQALISIPQIGIAVWGWVLIGLLYSYSKQIEFGNLASTNPLRKKKIKDSNAWGLQIALASVVGFLIAIPPYSADARWTGAVNTNDLAKFESALQRSYLSPSNSDRLVSAVYILEKSNFPEKAIVYARLGVEFNSDHFDAWRSLYYATNSTPDEKSLALKNMRRLDPLNRNLDKLK